MYIAGFVIHVPEEKMRIANGSSNLQGIWMLEIVQ
jgi:hypothetical protein